MKPMWDYYTRTHTRGRGSIKLQHNSLKREHATAISKNLLRERQSFTKGQTPQSRRRHQMLVGNRKQTSTKRPKGCLCWQMVWRVKGLMNHPILKAATNVGLLHIHRMQRDNINVNEIYSDRNMTLLLGGMQ